MAADARVIKFHLASNQEPDAVRRSGLLSNINELTTDARGLELQNDPLKLSRSVSRIFRLLNLGVDACKSLKTMFFIIIASPEIEHACGCILSNSKWEMVEKITIHCNNNLGGPGFLSGLLAEQHNSGTLPALKHLHCANLGASDILSLSTSPLVGRLTHLNLLWEMGEPQARNSCRSPGTVAAMRTLLHNASNLEILWITSLTYAFFDCEQLVSLHSLTLRDDSFLSIEEGAPDFAPALARPWKTLKNLSIVDGYLKGHDLVRIFEANDTLPVLEDLEIDCRFAEDAPNALSCVRRPHLKKLGVYLDAIELIPKLAQLCKADINALPNLQELHIDCGQHERDAGTLIRSISEFLSCPCVAKLETLKIIHAGFEKEGPDFLYYIANHCPKLKELDLSLNCLTRPAVVTLLGLGQFFGAWPDLKKLGGLGRCAYFYDWDRDDLNYRDDNCPEKSEMELKHMFRRVWPGLEFIWD